jgi:hypothetical protein
MHTRYAICHESFGINGLKVSKSMIPEVDNKGATDLAHNWTIGGRTHHVDVKYHSFRELKENGIMDFTRREKK